MQTTSVNDEIKEVTAIVHGVIMGIEMPFPLQHPDGCTNCGLSCPLSKSAEYEYQATLEVLKSYPKVSIFFDMSIAASLYYYIRYNSHCVFFNCCTGQSGCQMGAN